MLRKKTQWIHVHVYTLQECDLWCLLSDPVSVNGNGHNALREIDFILNCAIINLQVRLTPCWRDSRGRHGKTSCNNITGSKNQQVQHATGSIYVFFFNVLFQSFTNRPVSVLSRLKSLSLTYKYEIIRRSHEVSSSSEYNPPMLELK